MLQSYISRHTCPLNESSGVLSENTPIFPPNLSLEPNSYVWRSFINGKQLGATVIALSDYDSPVPVVISGAASGQVFSPDAFPLYQVFGYSQERELQHSVPDFSIGISLYPVALSTAGASLSYEHCFSVRPTSDPAKHTLCGHVILVDNCNFTGLVSSRAVITDDPVFQPNK